MALEGIPITPGPATGAYLEVDEARTLAATIPGMTTLLAETDESLAMLLLLASLDIDAGMRYQGRKYLETQVREFPRVPYEGGCPQTVQACCSPSAPSGVAAVWDWDSETDEAVVPQTVKVATLFQAAHNLDPANAERLEAIRGGLAAQSTADLSETYQRIADLVAIGGLNGLSHRTSQLLAKYRLKTGKML